MDAMNLCNTWLFMLSCHCVLKSLGGFSVFMCPKYIQWSWDQVIEEEMLLKISAHLKCLAQYRLINGGFLITPDAIHPCTEISPAQPSAGKTFLIAFSLTCSLRDCGWCYNFHRFFILSWKSPLKLKPSFKCRVDAEFDFTVLKRGAVAARWFPSTRL